MKTVLAVANAALVHVGETPIASLDQGGDKCNTVNAVLSDVIDELLRAHPWNFAIKRVALDPLADAPNTTEYANQFQRPDDWLRTIEVDPKDFKREGNVFLANKTPLYLRYVYRETDIAQWDTIATSALALLIASRIAFPPTKSNTLTETMFNLYKDKLAEARTIDAQEDPPDDFDESELITSRFGA